jgi:diadenosine tetraphosphate (Ap4A) HIT family hydrolase
VTAFATRVPGCALCEGDGGRLVHREAGWRVVGVDDAAFPAYYRVVCNAHVAEFGDLDPAERQRCMVLVAAVELSLRAHLRPTKVNLASLGNLTPHLHWHVIARFDWDSHFPQSVWGLAQRAGDAAALARVVAALPALDRAIAERLRYA